MTNFPTGEVWVAILGDLDGGARVGWSTPHVIAGSNDTMRWLFHAIMGARRGSESQAWLDAGLEHLTL